MARAVITVRALDDYNKFGTEFDATALATAVNAADGAEFVMSGADHKYLVYITNGASSAKAVTVKAGNGLQGTADISVSLGAGKSTYVSLESGRFKNVTGADKGKVVITGESADIKVAVFKLP